MLLQLDNFLTGPKKDNNFYIPKECITYERPTLPQPNSIRDAYQFIEAEKLVKEITGWKDDAFVKLFVKVSYAEKFMLPTKKDLEAQMRKMKKRLNKK